MRRGGCLKVGCVVIEQRLDLLSIVQRLRALARAHGAARCSRGRQLSALGEDAPRTITSIAYNYYTYLLTYNK